MTDKIKELMELEEKRKELLKEIKEEEKVQHKALITFFGDDFPRGENHRPISLKEFRGKYTVVEKETLRNQDKDCR